jgi:hypothetical protein
MGTHRILPDRKQYLKDYCQKVTKPRLQAARAEEEDFPSPRFFDIHSFLRNTGERNYCLSLFLGEKGKLIRYLDERGADEYQIAEVFQILSDIVQE